MRLFRMDAAMVRLLQHFRRLARDENGVAMILFAMMALVLIPVAGGALDYSSTLTVRARAAAAADAAALAIASRAQTDQATAKKLAAALLAAQYPVSERHGANINAPAVDLSVQGSVEVRISGSVPSLFLTVIGIAELPVSARAVARRSGQKVDVVMVLDNTGSMRGGKLAALKTAAKKLPERLLSKAKGALDAQIGLVPFTSTVNVGAERTDAWLTRPESTGEKDIKKTWQGCVLARRNPNDVRDTDHIAGGTWKPLFRAYNEYDRHQHHDGPNGQCLQCTNFGCSEVVPLSKILPLSKDAEQVNTAIDSMNADGSTAIPIGLAWGWRVLSPTAPFVEAQRAGKGQSPVRRVIILLTDGENNLVVDQEGTLSKNTAYGDAPLDNSSLNNRTQTLCDSIKGEGIQIYTINFEVKQQHKHVMKSCASTNCKGTCNYDGSSATIGTIFEAIANDLGRTRLAY